MGTRSLLAVETTKGNIHVQYMQFDGYPSVKGLEYYSAVINALIEAWVGNFITKSGKPNKRFRERAIHFLNDYQYKTHHSTGNHWKGTIKDDWGFQRDNWQEYEYLFAQNGDFIMDGGSLHHEIPWEVTKAIATCFSKSDLAYDSHDEDADTILTKFFENLSDYDAEPWTLEVETGIVNAFPDQRNNEGYRDYAFLRLKDADGKTLETLQSMFAKNRGKKANVKTYSTEGERDIEEELA
jgi:hypothetical protein